MMEGRCGSGMSWRLGSNESDDDSCVCAPEMDLADGVVDACVGVGVCVCVCAT